jgi:ABC-type multidrug transport system fused ATPase/permease subunit
MIARAPTPKQGSLGIRSFLQGYGAIPVRVHLGSKWPVTPLPLFSSFLHYFSFYPMPLFSFARFAGSDIKRSTAVNRIAAIMQRSKIMHIVHRTKGEREKVVGIGQ